MKFSIKSQAAPCRKSALSAILCALFACIAVPAIAAPGDEPHPSRAIEPNLIDQPAGGQLDYLNIAGSTFHPLDSTTTYSYPGGGCIAKTGGTQPLFVHRAILPQGATVRYVRLNYYDTSTSNVAAFFTTYDGAGNYNQLSLVSSPAGSSGYGSVLSSEFAFSVDQYTSAINVAVNLGTQNDSTLRLCGVRIAYNPPITDRIFANGFDPTPL